MDSRYGIPGHRFGEPLRAFPGLAEVPAVEAGLVSDAYPAPGGQEAGWFGKPPGAACTNYQFRAGRFVAVQAIAKGMRRAELRQAAAFLFGPARGPASRKRPGRPLTTGRRRPAGALRHRWRGHSLPRSPRALGLP